MRCFLALSISEQLESVLFELSDQCQQQLMGVDLNWVPAENYHITLAFLGDIHHHQLPEIIEVMNRVAASYQAVELSIKDLLWFPSIHNPKHLVVLVEQHDQLIALQRKLTHGLRQIGIDLPRQNYRPHITLARKPKHVYLHQVQKPLAINLPSITAVMDEMVLFESQLLSSGSRYTPLSAVLIQ